MFPTTVKLFYPTYVSLKDPDPRVGSYQRKGHICQTSVNVIAQPCPWWHAQLLAYFQHNHTAVIEAPLSLPLKGPLVCPSLDSWNLPVGYVSPPTKFFPIVNWGVSHASLKESGLQYGMSCKEACKPASWRSEREKHSSCERVLRQRMRDIQMTHSPMRLTIWLYSIPPSHQMKPPAQGSYTFYYIIIREAINNVFLVC